ncbi:MAG: hypothetical protein ACYC43_05355 [Burkholderiales bacterium]
MLEVPRDEETSGRADRIRIRSAAFIRFDQIDIGLGDMHAIVS